MSHAPVLYLPHGGGPLPLLGDPSHQGLSDFLSRIPQAFPKPKAILMISAHWEEEVATVTTGDSPRLIYDYGGFPPESYQIQYPAPGAPALAEEVVALLKAVQLPVQRDAERGFDHGMFVPLKLMYPEADIPVVQLSLVKGLDPSLHLRIGQALAPLREQNILVVGSGMSFHNMGSFFRPSPETQAAAIAFDNWLNQTCTEAMPSAEQSLERLQNWAQAPQARDCHPREEHLLPLHVCYGMAQAESSVAQNVYQEELLHHRVSAFLWQ